MNRLRFLRNEKGESLGEIAKYLNVTIQTISNYETEKRDMTPDTILKLAQYFNVSTDYLLGKTNIRDSIVSISKIPILGTVKAGYDWLAEENVVDYITIKERIPNLEEYYALRITGDSMLPLLSEGDLVIVHDQDDVESGQTAVVLINGEEATVKKLIKTNDGIELHAMNPYYPIRKFTYEDMKSIPVKIIGRVKEAKIKGAFE